MSEERAKKIKLMIFDVDGVMTDGTIFLFPAPAGSAGTSTTAHRDQMADQVGYGISSSTMLEAKGFNAHDGTGFSLLRLGGLKAAIITKRISETVALRARDLKIEHVYQGQQDKAAAFYDILAKESLMPEQVAYVGDDIIDLPVMRLCGLAIAVKNSRPEVLREAHFVTDHEGGKGAVRDAIEYILRAQGTLQRAIDDYIYSRSQDPATKVQ
ncbi:MAG TPA: HAD hydrolase family protein [Candidatus Angelobacter sp.]|jgi:3-deoxy-D-manno-octulosonate 8-phosphate phosphatase (KDO 8-P phosphatase)|nr:HAD hydrolase family protein [Candidatus Angelobacter sp.]